LANFIGFHQIKDVILDGFGKPLITGFTERLLGWVVYSCGPVPVEGEGEMRIKKLVKKKVV
jgi:hypothetical protein